MRTTARTTGRTTTRNPRTNKKYTEHKNYWEEKKRDSRDEKPKGVSGTVHQVKARSRRSSAFGEFKSSSAKKKAINKVKNPKARKALSKRHPKSPKPQPDRPRFF